MKLIISEPISANSVSKLALVIQYSRADSFIAVATNIRRQIMGTSFAIL